MSTFAVKNPVKKSASGARTNRTESEKKACRQPGRTSVGLDCTWGFTTRRPQESLSSAKMKERPLGRHGRPYTHGGELSETRLCHWPSNYNGQSLRTKRNETSRR